MILMCCGSRFFDNEPKAFAVIGDLTEIIAKSNRFDRIIMGDAHGADFRFAMACEKMGLNYIVYGIQPYSRNKALNYVDISNTCYNYQQRDDYMLNNCQFLLCVWNGKSKGTRRNYIKSLELNNIIKEWLIEV